MKSKLAIWSLVLPIISVVLFGGINMLLEKEFMQCTDVYVSRDVYWAKHNTFLCQFSIKNFDFGGKVAIFNLALTLLSLIFGIAALKVIKRNPGLTGKDLAIIGIILSIGLSLFWFFAATFELGPSFNIGIL